MTDARDTVVVKVGGSLFDLPDLGERLRCWLSRQGDARFVLVPGGAATADAVRYWDRLYRLGEEKSHWLALRALSLNAHLLSKLLPGACVIDSLDKRHDAHAAGLVPILDMHAFAIDDERHEGRLPHSWHVTSDSLAARVAQRLRAQRLVLLKSVTIDPSIGWQEAARRSHVDAFFPEIARRLTLGIDAINLRAGP